MRKYCFQITYPKVELKTTTIKDQAMRNPYNYTSYKKPKCVWAHEWVLRQGYFTVLSEKSIQIQGSNLSPPTAGTGQGWLVQPDPQGRPGKIQPGQSTP